MSPPRPGEALVVHQAHARIPFEGPASCETGLEEIAGQAPRSNGWAPQHRRDLVNQPEEGPKLVQKRDVLEFEEVAHAVLVERDHRGKANPGEVLEHAAIPPPSLKHGGREGDPHHSSDLFPHAVPGDRHQRRLHSIAIIAAGSVETRRAFGSSPQTASDR